MNLPLFADEHVAVTLAKESEYHPTPDGVLQALLDGMRVRPAQASTAGAP